MRLLIANIYLWRIDLLKTLVLIGLVVTGLWQVAASQTDLASASLSRELRARAQVRPTGPVLTEVLRGVTALHRSLAWLAERISPLTRLCHRLATGLDDTLLTRLRSLQTGLDEV